MNYVLLMYLLCCVSSIVCTLYLKHFDSVQGLGSRLYSIKLILFDLLFKLLRKFYHLVSLL